MKACDEQRFKDSRPHRGRSASLDGPGHAEGPPHRDRIPQRADRARGRTVGVSCRANAVLTDIVKKVERGELKPDPKHITELRLN